MNILNIGINNITRLALEVLIPDINIVNSYISATDGWNSFVKSHRKKDYYKIIFLNSDLPIISGFSLVKMIRSWEIENHAIMKIHIVLLSQGDAMDEEVFCLKHGCDEYFVMPFSIGKVRQTLTSQGFLLYE